MQGDMENIHSFMERKPYMAPLVDAIINKAALNEIYLRTGARRCAFRDYGVISHAAPVRSVQGIVSLAEQIFDYSTMEKIYFDFGIKGIAYRFKGSLNAAADNAYDGNCFEEKMADSIDLINQN